MVSSARLVLVLVLLAGMLAPGSAFSVLSMDVSPAEGVQPKDPIQVSGTLQLASPGTQGFPANHTLNFSTDLLKAAWNFTIVVDGVSRQNLELRGGEAVLYGFSLSYPNDTPVQVEIGLEGSVPPNASPSLTAIQVQEMDEQGLPLPGSAYSRAIRVIRPPAPPPTTAPEPTTLPLPSPSPTATTEPPPASLPTTPPPEPTPLPQPTTPVPTETATPVPPGGGAFPVLPLAILVLVGIALLAGGSLVQRRKGAGGAGGPSPTLPAPPPILNRSWDSWWQHLIPEGSDIQAGTLDAVFRIALELALEGREGRKVGTAFVVGDADAVLAHSRQLILNPFEGHPPEDRRITRPEMREAIKELAQLDGAFVVQGDGTIAAAARYITVDTSLVRLPSGFGTRHSSIAAITRMTRSIGIVVSQSGGKISILRDGKLLRTVSPFSQNPPQPHS
ncbi:MAG: diadenylate cyclase [Methanomicrobiales archaeon]|nr:diadenylate cyclase [Methanomicrobiales archaeon]